MNVCSWAFWPVWLVPIAPFAVMEEAIAAPLSQTKQAAQIPVVIQSDETRYFSPDTRHELPVVVQQSVVVNGITLPPGTVIDGRLEPVEGGLQYVTTAIVAGGLRSAIAATSAVLHDVKDPRETSGGAIAGDAAIGAAGGAVLGAILGDGVSLGEVVGGAAAGVVIGNVTAQRVVVLQPDEPILLTVTPE